MKTDFQKAYVAGMERIAAWSDLLDDINVFPVADGDTGRNLLMTLTPLRQPLVDHEDMTRRLLLSARGNSGNIAARFFSGLLAADTLESLPRAAKHGRDDAWQSISHPKPGTMLTVFDTLVDILTSEDITNDDQFLTKVIDHLENTVQSTSEMIPRLKAAAVVDSGALGMYIFLEGFFKKLFDRPDVFRPITSIFGDKLQIDPAFNEKVEGMYCVDTVIHASDRSEKTIQQINKVGNDISIIPYQNYLKIHLHTENPLKARNLIESIGDVVQWSKDDMEVQAKQFHSKEQLQAIHIMTDAAGSVTRKDSREWGITLLNSYITAGDKSLPETLFDPLELYQSMRSGTKVSTSQASVFERHEYYQSVLNRYEKVLYLCVGSVYTGNFDVAMKWKIKNDPDNRLIVIDTGTASGRLGLIVITTADFASRTEDPDAVVKFAKTAVERCEEYVFLDRLKYLAAGGRLSKTSAFLGDILHKKPIITPAPEGATKVGLVTNQEEQVGFALNKIEQKLDKNSRSLIMLEYSDNREWVDGLVKKEIENRYPFTQIKLQPLSLTSGVHMGPGTWAIAFLPEHE